MGSDRDADDPWYNTRPDAQPGPELSDSVSYELFAVLAMQQVADVSDGELLAGMSGWQRVIGFATSKMYAQMVELRTRRVAPVTARVAAARVTAAGAAATAGTGDAEDVRAVKAAARAAKLAEQDEVLAALAWSPR